MTEEVDLENASLILALQIDDLPAQLRDAPDDQKQVLTNLSQALNLQKEQIDSQRSLLADRRFQESIYVAMLADTLAIETVLNSPSDQQNAQHTTEVIREHGKDGFYEDHRFNHHGETSLEDYKQIIRIDEDHPNVNCSICAEDTLPSQVIPVRPCTHIWCRTCLVRAVSNAIQSENCYPIRCCPQTHQLPPFDKSDRCKRLLGADLTQQYASKVVEYSTDDRTYCHEPRCSTFIPPSTIQDRLAQCPKCANTTCSACKEQYHQTQACGEITQDVAFQKWKSESEASDCPRCHRTILISHGCHHMRCHCGTEFCYECNQIWKNCTCPLWNEQRLTEAAARVAELRGQPENAAEIANQMQHGRECRHTDWSKEDTRHLSGGVAGMFGRCQDCQKIPGEWLWACDDCNKRVCRRCQQNYR